MSECCSRRYRFFFYFYFRELLLNFHFSFGFRTIRDEWDYTNRDMPIRTLLEVELFEVSPVTFPAYPQTSAEARAKVAEIRTRNGEGVDATTRAQAQAQARASRLAQVRIAEIEI